MSDPLRVCMVTPFAWSRPHPVNEHVAGAAEALRARGHEVVVLAPSARAADLSAGRKALRASREEGNTAAAVRRARARDPGDAAQQVSSRMTARANLSLALVRRELRRRPRPRARHPEPQLPGAAPRRDADGRDVPFHRAPRLPAREAPARKAARARGRSDGDERRRCSRPRRLRWPGDFRRIPIGVDTELFKPAKARKRFALEWRPDEEAEADAAIGALAELPGWELVVLRTRALTGRPHVPRALRPRVKVVRAIDPEARAARARRARRDSPRPRRLGPAQARGGGGRRAHDRPARRRRAARARRRGDGEARRGRGVADEAGGAGPHAAAERESFAVLGRRRSSATCTAASSPAAHGDRPRAEPLADRPLIVVRPPHAHRALARLLDPRAPTCSTTPRRRASARSRSPTTTCSRGAQEAVELARGRDARRHPGRGGHDHRPAR